MGVKLWAGMTCAFEEASAVNVPAQACVRAHDRDNQPPRSDGTSKGQHNDNNN